MFRRFGLYRVNSLHSFISQTEIHTGPSLGVFETWVRLSYFGALVNTQVNVRQSLRKNDTFRLFRKVLSATPLHNFCGLVHISEVNFPTVYYLNNLQIGFDETLKATETERFILNAVLQGCGTINQLGRRTREKIRALLSRYVKYVEVSEQDYRRILWQLSSYKNGKLPTAATDPDQPPPKKPNIPDWVIEAEKAEALEAS